MNAGKEESHQIITMHAIPVAMQRNQKMDLCCEVVSSENESIETIEATSTPGHWTGLRQLLDLNRRLSVHKDVLRGKNRPKAGPTFCYLSGHMNEQVVVARTKGPRE